MRKGNAGIEPAGAECLLRDMAGRWKSCEGEPDIRIYRSGERKNGGFFMEFAYKTGDVFRRPIKQYFGILYFDLYDLVKLAYDVEHDVVRLSGYGDFYREES